MSGHISRVEWNYLEAMLGRLGFPEKLICLVMGCVRSISLSFLLNGQVYGRLKPQRGLRQGDPLSPFLFVICAHGLSSLIADYERGGRISGVPIAPRLFSITHLFFADDSLLFIRACREEALAIKEILHSYEMASGQLINFEKSSVSFSPNTSRSDMGEVKNVLGIGVESGFQMYLGLPAFSLRQKRLQFGYIRDRIQKKLLSWNQRELSAGGKEVLLKAVIQAMPTYAMQCFKLPDSVCTDVDRLCAGFWWGDKETGRKMHWAKWSALCKPKELGGVGFRDIRAFNKALLAKQVWRMAENPSSLVSRVFRARYCNDGDLLSAPVSSNASFVWRSLAWSRSLVTGGSCWRVGDGRDISVWRDNWVAGLDSPMEEQVGFNPGTDVKVSELLSEDGNWDQAKVEAMFEPFFHELIFNTPLKEAGDRDVRAWKFDEKGFFSVKSAYLLEIGFYKPDPHVWVFVCKLLHPDNGDLVMPSEENCEVMLDSYQAARPTLVLAEKLGVTLGEKKWRRPPEDRFRVDVDAMFDPDAQVFGVGVIIRNSEGRPVAALSKCTSASSSVMMAEIMAVVHGVVLCAAQGVAPVEIYTDSFLAARVMADPDEEKMLLPDDICEILRVARENCLLGVFHMYRSANMAAHSLALKAIGYPNGMCWTANFPPWLRDIVSADIS